MFHFRRAAILATTLAGIAIAAPAAAKPAEFILYSGSAQAALATPRVCTIAPASAACAAYQDRVIHAAAQKALGKDGSAGIAEVGRRQLDALLASLD